MPDKSHSPNADLANKYSMLDAGAFSFIILFIYLFLYFWCIQIFAGVRSFFMCVSLKVMEVRTYMVILKVMRLCNACSTS